MAPRYRYYDLMLGAFVAVLLCSNLIGVTKVSQVGGFSYGTGVLFFPISYLFGDILTEVYGYACVFTRSGVYYSNFPYRRDDPCRCRR